MKKVIIKCEWDTPISFEWKGSLIATLIVANDWTIANDRSGYFFEVENADPIYVRENKFPVFVNTYGVLVAPVEYDIEEDGMSNFYFTFGTDYRYPFCNGYIIIEAPNGIAAREIFKAYFPNRPGSSAINCAWIYSEEEFMKDWDWCWSKSQCHGIIKFNTK